MNAAFVFGTTAMTGITEDIFFDLDIFGGTTGHFLSDLGLRTLSELPPLEELGNLVTPDETALIPELREELADNDVPQAFGAVIETARVASVSEIS